TLEPSPPTAAQIRYVLFHNAVPFIGFGFLDNAIMIAAGTQIELSIGVTLGISTMAAAALGNLVSDLAGLGLAGYVEALASRLGMQVPDLTPQQADMWQTRLSSHMGKAIGITIGCILGMFPLLFLSDDEEEKENRAKAQPRKAQGEAGVPILSADRPAEAATDFGDSGSLLLATGALQRVPTGAVDVQVEASGQRSGQLLMSLLLPLEWRQEIIIKDGTLDDGITPIPDGPGGESSPIWLKPERDHA
ncbi:hypothetical protein CCH79_00014136, partial [Gambusia affinis]